MSIQSTNVNFQGKYCYAGNYASANKKAIKLVRNTSDGATTALRDFIEKNQPDSLEYFPGEGFLKNFIAQIRNPRHAITDIVEVGVREGKNATNGIDTLTIKHHRNVSGLDINGATVEVPMPQPPTHDAVLKALNDAKDKASEVFASQRDFISSLPLRS